MIEGSDVKTVLQREVNRLVEAAWGVGVIAKDERGVETDFESAEIFQRFRVAAVREVERLVHRAEVRRIQTLEPDQDSLTSAAREQLKELLVMRRRDAGLTDPAHAQRNHCAKEFFRLGDVRSDVVVHEEDQGSPAANRGH